MTNKQTGRTTGQERSPKLPSKTAPRTFGEQWTSKGDRFTRSVSQHGHSAKTAKPKRSD